MHNHGCTLRCFLNSFYLFSISGPNCQHFSLPSMLLPQGDVGAFAMFSWLVCVSSPRNYVTAKSPSLFKRCCTTAMCSSQPPALFSHTCDIHVEAYTERELTGPPHSTRKICGKIFVSLCTNVRVCVQTSWVWEGREGKKRKARMKQKWEPALASTSHPYAGGVNTSGKNPKGYDSQKQTK